MQLDPNNDQVMLQSAEGIGEGHVLCCAELLSMAQPCVDLRV